MFVMWENGKLMGERVVVVKRMGCFIFFTADRVRLIDCKNLER